MPPSSETFPSDVFRSLAPFIEDLDATGRRILVLMPYDGHPGWPDDHHYGDAYGTHGRYA